MAEDDDFYNDDDSFEGYISSTVDPGPLLFWITMLAVVLLMVVIMPVMVKFTKKRRKRKKKKKAALLEMAKASGDCDDDDAATTTMTDGGTSDVADGYVMIEDDDEEPAEALPANLQELQVAADKYKASLWSIIRIDRESRRIARYTIPFTVYAVAAAIMENVCLALVGNFIGTKQVAAYVIVILLTELTDEFLKGSMHANTTLCAHAIGAANLFLAGQYIQLSILFYIVAGFPVALFWSFATDKVVLALGWGDEVVANHAIQFARIYIWSKMFDAIEMAFSQLLEVTDQEVFTTIIGLLHQAANMVLLIVIFASGAEVKLEHVALIYLLTSYFFLVVMLLIANHKGWIKPFTKGIFRNFAVTNQAAVYNMIKTAIPLSCGSVLNNAEWTILAVFAAHMGEAEVAAWAIFGTLWAVCDSLVEGIGDAAEIRVAYHLGNNHPSLAKLSAYKSMMMGMVGACVISAVFYTFVDNIPALFTKDETLQGLLAVTLPYLGIANIAISFGYLCWYILGAQGKYKLGTWLNLASSWGVTLPLSAVFVYKFNWNLQGLTASVVMGYVCMGAVLAYCVLTANWTRRAQKIYDRNYEEESDDEDDDDDWDNEEAYAALDGHRTHRPQLMAYRNIKVLTAPPGQIFIEIGDLENLPGCVVVSVKEESPFHNRLYPGDIIIGVGEVDVIKKDAKTVFDIMSANRDLDRDLTVLTPYCRDEDTQEVLQGDVPDIPDFEEEGWDTLAAEKQLE